MGIVLNQPAASDGLPIAGDRRGAKTQKQGVNGGFHAGTIRVLPLRSNDQQTDSLVLRLVSERGNVWVMRTRIAFLVVAALVAAFTLSVDAIAQTNTAKLSLEQSTNGLTNWQRVPLAAEMLNNGDIDLASASSNSFYRMKIAMPTPAPTPPPSIPLVNVQGGSLPPSSRLAGTTVATFQIGKYEVTIDQWMEVKRWATTNGYSFQDGNAGGVWPVALVKWYDVVKWCNAKSEKEGLTPVYRVGGAIYKTDQSLPTVNSSANGYRLPREAEWEWAARGGVSSQGFTYSGSNNLDEVAWFYDNSSTGPKVGGTKAPNELGIYDLSGNLFEWTEDLHSNGGCLIRGGSYSYGSNWCAVDYRELMNPGYERGFIGFRVARNAP